MQNKTIGFVNCNRRKPFEWSVEIMQKKVPGNIQEILQSESTTHQKHQRNRGENKKRRYP